MRTIDLFIDNETVAARSNQRFLNIDPATGQTIAEVSEADSDDVDRAVAAAKRASRGPWASMGAPARAALLERVASRILERKGEFLAAEMADTGKPVSLASRIDIPRGAANFQIFANFLRADATQSFETPTEDGLGALNYVIRRPLGVVGVICPWNLPFLLMTWKVAPALAAGNTVVVKPSEETPATATLLGDVMREVGVPEGVYNVVHGFGPNAAGQHLVKHPDVAAITFTGESATGGHIMKDAASHIKALSFELGGKNPAIVFADCDVDAAIAGVAQSTFMNTGQVCLCSERIYVERSLFPRFVEGLREQAAALKCGDPKAADTTTGPLISRAHREKVMRYFELAREEGAEEIYGGGVPELDAPWQEGFFVEPTLWTGLSENARVVKEEIFGPCAHITPFDDEAEALQWANDTEYGLCAAVWTRDLQRAHRFAQSLEVGMTWVNTWYLRDLRTPFGGMKRSGVGREGGQHSLDFYSELKNICIKL